MGYFFNVYGLYTQTDRTKVVKFKDMDINMNDSSIVHTETWLTPDICDGEEEI